MDMKILVTNGDTHPASDWASVSAEHICDLIQIPRDSQSEAATVGRNQLPAMNANLRLALETAFAAVKDHERSAIADRGDSRLAEGYDDYTGYIDRLTRAVLDVTAKTVFSLHFQTDDVIEFIQRMMTIHVRHVAYLERSWWADMNPIGPAAQQFIASRVPMPEGAPVESSTMAS